MSDSDRDITTITLYREHKDALDAAAEAIFDTTEVPYYETVRRLVADHEDVSTDIDT